MRGALEAYASWLFMERRILCGELWPHMGAEAERFDWFDNAGAGWHFGEVRTPPSTRAAAVLDLVGVELEAANEGYGVEPSRQRRAAGVACWRASGRFRSG